MINMYLVFYLETELWTPNYDYVSPVHDIIEFYSDNFDKHIRFFKNDYNEYNTGSIKMIQKRSYNSQITHYHIFENKTLAEEFRNQLLNYKQIRSVPSKNKWLVFYMVNHMNPEKMYTFISPPFEVVDEDLERCYYIDNHTFSHQPQHHGPYKNFITKNTIGYSYAYYWKVFDTREEAKKFHETLKTIHDEYLNVHNGPTKIIREFYDKLPEIVTNDDRFHKLQSTLQ